MSRKKSLSDKINLNTPGGRIKSVRLSSGLNQYKFAKLLGIKQGTLSDIENGKRKPSERILIAIEYRFSILPEQILTGEQNKSLYTAHEAREKYTISPNPIEQIVSGFTQLFKDQKKEIEKLHETCEEILERISSLEKKGAGNAGAGSGSHAHTGDATRQKES